MVRYLSRAVRSLVLDRATRQSTVCRMEALEGRVLMSSAPLGFAVNFPLANILNLNVGSMSYNASTDSFDDQGTPQSFQIGNRSLVPINSPSDFELHIKVDNSGNLMGSGSASSDVVLTGSIDVNGDGAPDYTGTLLTGTITQFAAGAAGANPVFQFRLTPTGGSLENTYFTGQDIGVTLNSENSNFVDFTQSFVGLTKAVVGPITALPGSISGQVVDQCAGNAGINGVKMDLTGTDAFGNAVSQSTTTASIGGVNGEYSFANLAIGNYTVTEEQPANFLQGNNSIGTVNGLADGSVSGDVMSNVAIGSGQNGINYNFGEVEPVSISGTVYLDSNLNSVQDAGDSAIPNVTLTLIGGNDQGVINPITTTTDSNGNYTFGNLRPGTYTILETQPYGYYMEGSVAGSPVDGLANRDTIARIVVGCGQNLTGYNFAHTLPATLSGQIFDQCTGGTINGVLIQLLDSNGNVVNSQLSANNGPIPGAFQFINILAGTYQLHEVQPAGYLQGTNSVGTVGGTTDGTVSGDTFSNIVLGSNATGIHYNFGEMEPTSISGTVFKDANANGTQDAGETGIQNVNITLTGSNDQGTISPLVIATDASGNYSFTNLRPGTYTVTETAPAGYVQGTTTAGNPLNGSASGNVISAIVDTCCSTLVGYNFAEQTPPPAPQLCCISGTKFQDITGNGFSADDTPMAGITIQLFNNIGNTPFKTTVTGSNGTYSFANMPLGTYYVKEVCPSNEVRTGPALSDTYTINATAGINYGGNNFDNYVENCCCCCCSMSCLSFTITSVNGCVKTVSDLSGQTHEGDKVTANFCLKGAATLSLVSYTAPDAFFNANDASQQVVFQSTTQNFTKAGCYSETVICPDSNYQIDFVCGNVIDKLGPAGSNIFYHAQNRFISGDNEGCNDATHNLSSLSGNVFYDANNDGKLDNGEAGLGSVGVTLTGTDFLGNAVSKTTNTSSNGNYTFTGLRMGSYKVTEAAVSGYQQGKTTVGTSGGSANGNVISGVMLYANTSAINYIFAEIKSTCTQLSCSGFSCGGYSSCQPCTLDTFSCSSPVNQCDSLCFNLGCNVNCGQCFWC